MIHRAPTILRIELRNLNKKIFFGLFFPQITPNRAISHGARKTLKCEKPYETKRASNRQFRKVGQWEK